MITVEHLIVNGQLAKTLQAIGINTTRSKFQLHQLLCDLAASQSLSFSPQKNGGFSKRNLNLLKLQGATIFRNFLLLVSGSEKKLTKIDTLSINIIHKIWILMNSYDSNEIPRNTPYNTDKYTKFSPQVPHTE